MGISGITSSILPSLVGQRVAFDPSVANNAAQNTPAIPFQNLLIAQIEPIKPRYDLYNMSPREIDEFVNELANQQNGEDFNRGLMLLASRGAALSSRSASEGLSGDALNTKTNVVAFFEDSMAIAQSKGQDTASYQKMLTIFDVYQQGQSQTATTFQKEIMSNNMMASLIKLQEMPTKI